MLQLSRLMATASLSRRQAGRWHHAAGRTTRATQACVCTIRHAACPIVMPALLPPPPSTHSLRPPFRSRACFLLGLPLMRDRSRMLTMRCLRCAACTHRHLGLGGLFKLRVLREHEMQPCDDNIMMSCCHSNAQQLFGCSFHYNFSVEDLKLLY